MTQRSRNGCCLRAPSLSMSSPPAICLRRRRTSTGKLAPMLDDSVNLPMAYFGGGDATGRAVVLMEDLTDRGAEFGEATAAASVDEVALGIEQLAALHAQFWKPAALQRFPWLGQTTDIIAIMRFLVTPDHFERYIHRAADG